MGAIKSKITYVLCLCTIIFFNCKKETSKSTFKNSYQEIKSEFQTELIVQTWNTITQTQEHHQLTL